MIQLYGISRSRAGRCVWALEEIGLEYEQIPIDFRNGGTRTPEYLAVNPNGRIPTLVDGDVKLFESMAINHYLAARYDGGLRPRSVEDQGRALAWSFWVTNEVEHLVRHLMRHRLFLHPDDRDEPVAESAADALRAPLGILDHTLQERSHLVGDRFGVADLNVSHPLLWLETAGFELAPYPELKRWLLACSARPALAVAQQGSRPVMRPEDVRASGEPDPRGGFG